MLTLRVGRDATCTSFMFGEGVWNRTIKHHRVFCAYQQDDLKPFQLPRITPSLCLVLGVGNDPTFHPYQGCTNPSQLTE